MRVKRIRFIRNFGIFRDFRGDEQMEFGKFNLIYGWNYSGKTTLSRVFRALELGELPQGFVHGKYCIELDDGAAVTEVTTVPSPPVRVFNSDYIADELEFALDSTRSSAIVITGKATKEKLERLACWRKLQEVCRRSLQEKRDSVTTKQGRLDALASAAARSVRDHFGGMGGFQRPQLESVAKDIQSQPKMFVLSDEELTTLVQSFHHVGELRPLHPVLPSIDELDRLIEEASRCLRVSISVQTLDDLRESEEVWRWAFEGMSLHEDGGPCRFCRNRISEERWRGLQGHFSTEYRELAAQVARCQERLNAVVRQEEIALPDREAVVPELREDYDAGKEELGNWWESLRSVLEEMLVLLDKKLSTPSDTYEVAQWPELRVRGLEGVRRLRDVLERHNAVLTNEERRKEEIVEKVKRHYAAVWLLETEEIRQEYKEEMQAVTLRQAAEEWIGTRLRSLEREVSGPAVGAARFQELVQALLGRSDLGVELVEKDKYRLTRDGKNAGAISDGEKTAVALAHFLCSCEEVSDLGKLVVFVDDPVSSLDEQHVYSVAVVLARILGRMGQVFLATHDFKLLNYFKKEWLAPGGRNKREGGQVVAAAFCVEGMGQDAGARIVDLPPVLRKYKSEYEYVFGLLYGWYRLPKLPPEVAYHVPNTLRRFLEAYLGFRCPYPQRWSDKLDLIVEDVVRRDEVVRVVNEYSHLQDLRRAQTHVQTHAAIKRCLDVVMEGLKERDPQHWEGLKAACGLS